MAKHYLTVDVASGIMEWDDLDFEHEEYPPEIVDQDVFEWVMDHLNEDDFIAAEITDEGIYERLKERYSIYDIYMKNKRNACNDL